MIKDIFDYSLALVLLLILGVLMLVIFIIVTISMRESGIYTQKRVGKNGEHFVIYKFKTMQVSPLDNQRETITTVNDPRITKIGHFLRKTKLDELPQIVNIIKGEMSFVGPRPDVVGYADDLKGEDRIILTVKPGITGPATIKYRNEEYLLGQVENPKQYNDQVIWPDKVAINKDYVENWSLKRDMDILFKTFFG